MLFYTVHRPEGIEVPAQAHAVDYEYEWIDEKGNFIVDYIEGQDVMAWVTQGEIVDRTAENITKSDVGIVTLRKMFRESMQAVAEGRGPGGRDAGTTRRDRVAARTRQVRTRG